MFSVSLAYFLTAYLIFLVIFAIFSAANVYHIYSTGTFTAAAALVTTIVIVWCLLVLVATYLGLLGVNWQSATTFFGSGSLLNFNF